MNKENLEILAEGILGMDPEAFHMGNYRRQDIPKPYSIKFYSLDDCGTVGCAIGWSPFISGLEITIDDFISTPDESRKLDFFQYSKRIFRLSNMDEWQWIFNADWEITDNTPQGVYCRIMILLTTGLPNNWNEQMERQAPLDYVEAIGEI